MADDIDTLTRAVVKKARANADGDAEAPWPEPDLAILSPHRESAPEAPLDLLGSSWSNWVEVAAQGKGAPPDYVMMALLAAAAALLARHRRASPWAGWAEPPIIWVALIGNPSAGKSPAIDAVAELMRKLEEELDADRDDRRREWKCAKLAAELAEGTWQAACKEAHKQNLPLPAMPAAAEAPDAPQPRRLVVNDATIEKLVRLSAGSPHGLLFARDELAGWLGAMDKYGGTGADRALWLEAFGGRPYRLDRVKDGDKPVETASLAIAINGGIQPDRLASMILAGDDDGLAARLLFTWPEPRKPVRPRQAADNAAALARLRRLGTLVPLDRPVPFAPVAADALQHWREEMAELERDAAGLVLSWIGKLPGYAVRLALVIEFLWWCGDRPEANEPPEVSLAAVEAACAFLSAYALPMARRTFGDAALPEPERDAALLAKWIMGQRPVPSDLNGRALRHVGALPTRVAARFDAALAELMEAGWVRPAAAGRDGPGRKRKDWEVNPVLVRRQ